MHHFVVAADNFEGDTIVFSAAQAHQIARVLRLRSDDAVVVLDGQGAQFEVGLTVEGNRVRGTILRPSTACREPRLHVTLLVVPPRGERWDWLLQKGTEVGISCFVPLITRYSQPSSATIKPRQREIMREATEQCRRLLLPRLEEARPFDVALREPAVPVDTVTVLLWEAAGADRALTALLRPALRRGVRHIRLIVGREGGFHPDEVALARSLGSEVASLGPLVLRVETAGVVAGALTVALDDGV